MTTLWCEIKRKRILYFAYVQAALSIIAICFTNLVVNQFRYVFNLYYMKANLPYIIAMIFYFVFVTFSYIELVKFLHHAKGSQRTHTLYNIFGFMFGFLGGSTTFLPMFHIDIIYPAGNFGITIYVLILSYAIFRHQLMDFTFFIKKTVAYSLVLLLLIAPCFIVVIVTEKYLPHGLYYPVLACIFMLVGFVFPRIKVQAERNLENILFKGVFDYREALDKLSKKMATLHNLEELLDISTQTIARAIDTNSFGAYLLGRPG